MLDLNFTPFPNLATDRLVLRQLTSDDANEIYLLRSDESVNKYLDRDKATVIDDATNFINKIRTSVANNESLYWAISIKGNNSLIGTICLFSIDIEKDIAEIGYELIPKFQGKGFMQESISTVIKFAFDNLRIKTITAALTADNCKSVTILERNNFKIDRNFTYVSKEELKNLTCFYLEQSNQ
ncbi:MAG: GNAT family N-acetyltransferase [Bacteroidota bacterium]|nr:GNAT family N-acetyltransferase [Bacteroidota bacterium]